MPFSSLQQHAEIFAPRHADGNIPHSSEKDWKVPIVVDCVEISVMKDKN